MRCRIATGLAIAGIALPVGAAEDASRAQMRAELQRLKTQLQQLNNINQRVETLEAQLAAQDGSGDTQSGGSGNNTSQTASASGGSQSQGEGQASATTVVASEAKRKARQQSDSSSSSDGNTVDGPPNDSGQTIGNVGGVQVSTGAGEPRDELRSRSYIEKVAGDVYDNQQSKTVKVGGALRYNYTVAEFNEPQEERGGDFNFGMFRLNMDADIEGLLLSAEYRFYTYMRTLHHGWVGYQVTDNQHFEIGLTKVPFGILPYASNNFYFSSNYYTGFEDDYDIGVKYVYQPGQWDIRTAFFKNAEDFGVDRYSVDPIGLNPLLSDGEGNTQPATQFAGGLASNNTFTGFGQSIQESNTGNVRVAYNFEHADQYVSEVGVSGQYGRLYNNTTGDFYGDNQAIAVHLHGNYGPWELMLQGTRYDYDLDNGEQIVGLGYFSANYAMPAEATSWLANLSYTFELNWGPLDTLELYNDYTYIGNKSGGFASTWQNATGAALAAGNLYTYFDLINGKNEPFINGSLIGDRPETQTLFNINMGYYF